MTEAVKPKCTIIIVNWNGRDSLSEFLKSIVKFESVEELQVIVSDNGSVDGSLEMCKDFNFLEVVENGENIGFGGGNNRAIPLAKSDYILFANPDMLFIEPVIERLIDALDSDPKLGACGPKIFNADGSFMRQCKRGFPDPLTSFFYVSGLSYIFPSSKRVGKYFLSHLSEDEPTDVDALSGSFFLAKSSALREVGEFDESYFLFVEEVDLFLRMRRAGFRLRYEPSVKIVHIGGACFEAMPNRKPFYSYHMTRSHLILWARERLAGKSVFNSVGYHIAFILIIIRYAVVSIVQLNLRFFSHAWEFFRIHFGAIEKGSVKG